MGFGTPFAFFLVALGTHEVPGIDIPGPDSTRLRVHAWFVERCGEGAVKLAGVFSLVAAVLAIALLTRRLLAQRRGTRTTPWRAGLTLYRLTIIGALGSLIVGFIWTRATQHHAGELKGWPAIANEHDGAVLIVVLVAALVVAGIVVELVMPSIRKALRQ